jgi:hypothetical protein
MAIPAHSWPRPLIQFRNHFSQTVGLLGRVMGPSQSKLMRIRKYVEYKEARQKYAEKMV